MLVQSLEETLGVWFEAKRGELPGDRAFMDRTKHS